MPARDGTGPMGQGPYSGRGFGRCNSEQSNKRSFYGRGRRCFSYDNSKESLEAEKKALRDRLDYIDSKLNK